MLNDIGSLFASKHFSSQDWILFTNDESLHMLSAHAKPGQELRALSVSSWIILRTTVGAKYNHLHSKDRKTESDPKPCFLTQ